MNAKLLLFALLLVAAVVLAQTQATITANPQGKPGNKLSVDLTLNPPVRITSFTCAVTTLNPGQSTPCTIGLAGPAPATGVTVELNYPASVTGNSQVVIAPGAASATFTVTYKDPDSPLAFWPGVRTVAGPAGVSYWADLMTAPKQ